MPKELPSQQNKPFIDPQAFDIKPKRGKGRPLGRLNNKALEKLAEKQTQGKEEDI